MHTDVWFDALLDALGAQGHGGPAAGAAPVSDDERDALLDLARVAAHTSERWTAPISTYLAGLAVRDVDPTARAAVLRRLVEVMESVDVDGA